MKISSLIGIGFLVAIGVNSVNAKEIFRVKDLDIKEEATEAGPDDSRALKVEVITDDGGGVLQSRLFVLASSGVFMGVDKKENDQTAPFLLNSYKTICCYVIKSATQAYSCNCVAFESNGNLLFYRDINSSCEQKILATKGGKDLFGEKLDLSWCTIVGVEQNVIKLKATVSRQYQNHPIYFSVGIKNREIDLISWHYDSEGNDDSESK